MKELFLTIAQKIATDKNPNTILVCCSILKDSFLMQGQTEKESNIMAIDGIKIILKTMIRIGGKI
jgi:hypothetical protein